jgi:hypothetical protein
MGNFMIVSGIVPQMIEDKPHPCTGEKACLFISFVGLI